MNSRWRPAAALAAGLLFCALQSGAGELQRARTGATPPLALRDLAGMAHALADYRGKVVVLNFWATWCEPCREEMPSLDRLRQAYAGGPVAILAVNMGEGEARIGEFLKSVPVGFTVLLDRESATARAWKVRLLPTTFILDRDGNVRFRSAGDRDWADGEVRTAIGKLLEEPPAPRKAR